MEVEQRVTPPVSINYTTCMNAIYDGIINDVQTVMDEDGNLIPQVSIFISMCT